MMPQNNSSDGVEIRAMRPAEEATREAVQFISFREYANGPDDPRWYDPMAHGKLHRVDPRMQAENNRMLFYKGRLATAVTVFIWQVRLNGYTPTAGCIGGVCTHPDFRHRGYVRQVMADAIAFMRRKGCALSWLYGKEAVYGSSGYRPFNDYTTLHYRAPEKPAAGTADAYQLRRVDLQRDIGELAAIYDSWNAYTSGPILRSTLDWRQRVVGPDARQGWDKFTVIEKNGRIAGYFQDLGHGEIGEFGALTTASLPELLSCLTARCSRTLNFQFNDSRLAAALREMPGQIEQTTGAHGLWLLLDPEQIGLSASAATDDLVTLLKESAFQYYKMDRF